MEAWTEEHTESCRNPIDQARPKFPSTRKIFFDTTVLGEREKWNLERKNNIREEIQDRFHGFEMDLQWGE